MDKMRALLQPCNYYLLNNNLMPINLQVQIDPEEC